MQRPHTGSTISSPATKDAAPPFDPETGWLLVAAEGEQFVNAHDVQATSGRVYSKHWAALCRAAGIVPQRLVGQSHRERFVTLAEARRLLAVAGRSPPPAGRVKRGT